MYTSSASLFDKLYHFKDYPRAAESLKEVLARYAPRAQSLLDVGCATGKHLSELKGQFRVAGLDISKELLDVARERCPDVPFFEGDMADFELDDRFDVVTCLFASIAYVKTRPRLSDAVAKMAAHLNPEGLLVVEPWLSPEQYWTENVVLNQVTHDPREKISWMYVGKNTDGIVENEIHFLVGRPTGVQHFVERHFMGLFSHEDYLNAFENAGMQLLHHDSHGFFGNGLYVARLKR